MKCNVALWDRIIRFLLGTILTSWAFSGGPQWSYLGLYLLFTAGWGFCLFYAILRINTIKELKSSNRLMSPPDNEL